LSAKRCITGWMDMVTSCFWTQNLDFNRQLAIPPNPSKSL
jgi:hypothetical protein